MPPRVEAWAWLGLFDFLCRHPRVPGARWLLVAAIRRAASPGVTRLPGGRHGRPRLLAAVIRRAVRRRCPAPSCLAQALALQRLLEARGFAARLKLGLVPSARPPLGHAWVECDGTPVGGSWRLTRRYISCETS